MLLSIAETKQKYGVDIFGVIHIGAHKGQEYEEYVKAKIKSLIFFEPVATSYRELLNNIKISKTVCAYNIALGNETGVRMMYVESANDGMSSSFLKPKIHLVQYPQIPFESCQLMDIDKLDNVPFDRGEFNCINIDVQGFELDVFKGAVNTLKHIEIIYSEVNAVEMYEGCALVSEIDGFLSRFGFKRMLDNLGDQNWGEAIYLKY